MTAPVAPERFARLKTEWEAIPFWQLLGIRLTELAEGSASLRLRVEPRLYAPGEVLHGGFLVSLIDTAVGCALKSWADLDDVPVLTLNVAISYLRAARGGEVSAHGQIIRRGRTTAVGEGEVTDEGGELIARGLVTYSILR